MRAWGPAAVWAAVLFLLSARSGPFVPIWFLGVDKLAHAGLYAVLGATLGYGKHHSLPSPPHWMAIGMGALYGATDEWHQAFVPGRSPELYDYFADLTGVTMGYTVVVLALGWLASRRDPREREKGVDVSQ